MLSHLLRPRALALASTLLFACGHRDENPSEQTTRGGGGGDGGGSIEVDGKSVGFFKLGEPVEYAGQLAPADETFQFSTERAFTLAAPATLVLQGLKSASADCAGSDLVGPAFMLLKIEGGVPAIVRTTEGAEANGAAVPATDLASFPGALAAGTYVLSVDYMSLTKPCSVDGVFALVPRALN